MGTKQILAMAAKGLFLAVALVAFAGCVAIDVEPLVEPIVALEEIEGAAPAAKTDVQPSKQAVAAAATKQLPGEKGSTAVADNNSAIEEEMSSSEQSGSSTGDRKLNL